MDHKWYSSTITPWVQHVILWSQWWCQGNILLASLLNEFTASRLGAPPYETDSTIDKADIEDRGKFKGIYLFFFNQEHQTKTHFKRC